MKIKNDQTGFKKYTILMMVVKIIRR